MNTGKAQRSARTIIGGMGEWLVPPRFLLFMIIFPVAALGWRGLGHSLSDSCDMGFDLAALLFLLSLLPLFLRPCDSAAMRLQAARNDANRLLVLTITSTLTVVIMAAIAGEIPRVAHGGVLALVRVIATLMLTWLFANVIYALHYAHLYYSPASGPGAKPGTDARGLDFPGGEDPDYLDFVYFAFTLGMTFQTADVAMSGKPMRRIAILHGFAAFVFNIGVIAFTINAIGGSAGAA